MTWLFTPETSSPDLRSAPEGGTSNWDSVWPWGTDTEVRVTSSGILTARPAWWRGWQNRPWSLLLSGTISQPSMAQAGVERLISSLLASRASRGASLASKKAPTTSGGSGPTSRKSFATWDPATSCWKTSQLSLLDVEGSMKYSEPWPPSGSMRNGKCFQRQPLVLHRSEIEYGFSGGDADVISHLWATPKSSQSGPDYRRANRPRSGKNDLTTQAALWPTPTVHDARSKGPSQWTRHTLSLQMTSISFHRLLAHSEHGGKFSDETPRLNPRFVEWLMGCPQNWSSAFTTVEPTVFDSWETQSYRRLLLLLSFPWPDEEV